MNVGGFITKKKATWWPCMLTTWFPVLLLLPCEYETFLKQKKAQTMRSRLKHLNRPNMNWKKQKLKHCVHQPLTQKEITLLTSWRMFLHAPWVVRKTKNQIPPCCGSFNTISENSKLHVWTCIWSHFKRSYVTFGHSTERVVRRSNNLIWSRKSSPGNKPMCLGGLSDGKRRPSSF